LNVVYQRTTYGAVVEIFLPLVNCRVDDVETIDETSLVDASDTKDNDETVISDDEDAG